MFKGIVVKFHTYPVERLVIVRRGCAAQDSCTKMSRPRKGSAGILPASHPLPSHAWRRHVRDPLGHTSRLDRTRTRRRLFVFVEGLGRGRKEGKVE